MPMQNLDRQLLIAPFPQGDKSKFQINQIGKTPTQTNRVWLNTGCAVLGRRRYQIVHTFLSHSTIAAQRYVKLCSYNHSCRCIRDPLHLRQRAYNAEHSGRTVMGCSLSIIIKLSKTWHHQETKLWTRSTWYESTRKKSTPSWLQIITNDVNDIAERASG